MSAWLSERWRTPWAQLWLGSTLIFAAILLSRSVPAFGPLRPYVAPVLMLYLPLWLDRRDTPLGWGLPSRRGAVEGLVSLLVILGGFWLVTRFWLWGPWGVPAEGWWTRLGQESLFAALPEETFFRGWILLRLQAAMGGRGLGVGSLRITRANAWTALVFALVHLADTPDPARLSVFVPALWFGWLTLRSSSIWPAVVAHALSNLAMAAAQAGG